MTTDLTTKAAPANPTAVLKALLPNATKVAFGNSNTMPKTTRKRIYSQRLTRPHTNNPCNYKQDSNYELHIPETLGHIIYCLH